MKPTHITIIGRSKAVFTNTVIPRLDDERVAHLIHSVTPAPQSQIDLSPYAKSHEHIQPLIRFLQSYGISHNHIRVHYPRRSTPSVIHEALSPGLLESGLSFGPDVAERDLGLSRYFVRTPSYLAVSGYKRHIVVGPKGSGKSAILKELSDRENLPLVITPEHYATEVLDTIRKKQIGGATSAYVTTWKYSLLIEIFSTLVRRQVGERRALARIRSYLAENGHLDPDLTLFERFLTYLRRISKVRGKIGPAELDLEHKADAELERIYRLADLLELLPALKIALRRNPFTVFIDELDQSWDNSETANIFLISLLIAAIQLRGVDDNLHVVVFLRSEIFDLLKGKLSQLDKLRSDIEVLRWSEEELTRLIASRTLDSLKIRNDHLDAGSVIRSVFQGRVEEAGEELFPYLLSRTCLRPREVIQFCNLALRSAVRLDHRFIMPDDVLRAEEEFSIWRFDHIIAENLFIYPGLDDVLERLRHQPRELSYSALDDIASTIILEWQEAREKPEWIKALSEPVDLMRRLYEVEVIGIRRGGRSVGDGRRPWDGYEWAYSRPRGRVERSQSFLFHPSLWKALELA